MILGGALLLAIAVTVLALARSAVLDGFSGLVIWMFLGYCAIIVVAQVGEALRALFNMANDRKQHGTGGNVIEGSER
jgi:hypothetical protein